MHNVLMRGRIDELEVLITQLEYRMVICFIIQLADILLFRIVKIVARSKPGECVSRVYSHFSEMSNKAFPDRMG